MNHYISAFPRIRSKLYESFDTLFGIHNPFKKTPPRPHWEDKTDELVLPGTVLPDDFFEGVKEPTVEEYENIKILCGGEDLMEAEDKDVEVPEDDNLKGEGEEKAINEKTRMREDKDVEMPEDNNLKSEGEEKAKNEKVIVLNEGDEGVDELEKMIKDGSVEVEEINEVGDVDGEGGGE